MVHAAYAQPRKRVAPVAAEAPSGSCVIAEFRHIALTVHDPQERQNKAIEWLQKNGSFCALEKMFILVSSKASLLGTADSVALGTVIDSIIEKRMGGDHVVVSRYYQPDVQSPGKSREEATAVKTTGSSPAPNPMRRALLP